MDEGRRQRVNRIKRMILVIIATAIVALVFLCVLLGVKINKLKKELARTKEQLEIVQEIKHQVEENSGSSGETLPESDARPESEDYKSAFAQEVLQDGQETVADTEPYYIYLTFDDGPSENTGDVLKVLREYGVLATFFVNGKTDEASLESYSEIVRAGHTLGMHSYSHKYSEIYSSQEAFSEDMISLRRLLKKTTGVTPIYYRFPGGSSTTATGTTGIRGYIDVLHQSGVEYIDWNIDSQDGSGKNLTADEIVDNVFANFGAYHTNVVLLHDGPGHKATVEALPRIIERARNMGAILAPITEDTVPVQHTTTE